jgi:ATP-dependent Clp protease ATP-binding subunit ClpC
MRLADEEARGFHHEYIGTEHILLGLVKEGSGLGADALRQFGVDLRQMLVEVDKLIKSGPKPVTIGKLPPTPRAKRVIEYAIDEASKLGDPLVDSEHLLLGLLRVRDGVAAQVLHNLGCREDPCRRMVSELRGGGETPGHT